MSFAYTPRTSDRLSDFDGDALARASVPAHLENSLIVTPMGIEPMISWMKTKCPRPLDDGAAYNSLCSHAASQIYLTVLTNGKPF